MFQAYRKKQTTTNWRQQMGKQLPQSGSSLGQSRKPQGKATGTGIFKHQDTRYMKWLKNELDQRETMDKLISVRNNIIEANKRVKYRNQIDRMHNEIQRGNLNHNTLEHLQHQINQFKNLSFT